MRRIQLTPVFLWFSLLFAAMTPFGLFDRTFQDAGLAGAVLLILLAAFDFAMIPGGEWLKVERETPKVISAFAPTLIELRLRATGRTGVRMRIKDHPPAEFEANGHDQRVWVSARRDTVVHYTVTARRRGEFDFGDLAAEAGGPLGFAARRFFIPLSKRVPVYPDVRPLRQYVSLLARREEGAMGLRTKKYYGQGSSLESLRPYVEGDDPRKLDWKATARAGTLIVRNYEEEPYQDVVALIDCGRRMRSLIGEKTRLDYAVDATLLLAYAAGLSRDNIGLVAFDDKVQASYPARSGAAALKAIGAVLHRLQPRLVEPAYEEVLTQFATRNPRRSLLILFSDITDEYSSQVLIRNLVALRQRHIVALMLFQDLDIENEAGQMPKSAKGTYRKAAALEMMRIRQQAIRQLRTAGVDVLETPASELAIETVNAYFRAKAAYF